MFTTRYHLKDDELSIFMCRISARLLRGLMMFLLLFWMHMSPALSSSPSSGFNSLSSELSVQLADNLHGKPAPADILVVNFVDISKLHCTSRFGQLVSERLRSLLAEKGWQVLEARTGLKVTFEKDRGPFILSDETKDLVSKIPCGAVLAGTYLLHKGIITVNAQLISVPGNRILTAAAAETGSDPYIFSLLKPQGFGCNTPPGKFIRIKPFSDEQLSYRENDAADIQVNYFKEESRDEN